MLSLFARASEDPLGFITCIALAAAPSFIWLWIFNRKHHEKKTAIFQSFVLGMASALIILLYQYFWGQNFNLGFFTIEGVNFDNNIRSNIANQFFASLLVFMSVGLIEEYSKHWVIKKADRKYFESIDDVIELSIVAALGFAFLENIGYFFYYFLNTGMSADLINLFIMRSLFVVFIHILCSGIYGYFYGVGYFSKEVYKDEIKAGKRFFIPSFLHRVFHLKTERVFHDEMISLGLIISVVVHGLYDFILDMNYSLGQVLNMPSLNHVGLHYVALPMFLIFGFLWLDKVINREEDHKVFGRRIVIEQFTNNAQNSKQDNPLTEEIEDFDFNETLQKS
jgi:RsiW-degrading membrane proteinase PrsW (M82 family)